MYNDLLSIRDEIQGERLLFENRMAYTDKEKQLMLNAVRARMQLRIKTYPYLMFGHFQKLIQVCGEDNFNFDDIVDLEILRYAILENRKHKKHMAMMEDAYDYSEYIAHTCYGCRDGMHYSEMVSIKILDVIGLRAALENNNIYSKYSFAKTEFFITNNFLLKNYLDFYSESDIEQLKNIAKYWVSGEEEAKRAQKVMNRTIKKYEKDKKKQNVKSKTIYKNKKND